jgi:hypothetical protein
MLMVETTEDTTEVVRGSEPFGAAAEDMAWGVKTDEDAGPKCETGSDLVFEPAAGACVNSASGPGWGGGSVATVTRFGSSGASASERGACDVRSIDSDRVWGGVLSCRAAALSVDNRLRLSSHRYRCRKSHICCHSHRWPRTR